MKLKVLTIDELNEKLEIPKKTIYKWTGERKISCAKLGKHLRFVESDLDQWLKSLDSFKNGKSI